jgi:competence protein ComEC
MVLAAVGLVLTATAAQLVVRGIGPLQALAVEHGIATLEGTVASDPVVTGGHRFAGTGVRLVLDVRSVTSRGATRRVSSPVLVLGGEAWHRLQWHARVRTRARILPARPGDPVVAVVVPSAKPTVVAGPGPVETVAAHLRSGLRTAAAGLPPDARGLLPALVIGDTSETPQDLTEAMRATGMTHLSAVSGSNVAIVLTFALGAARLLGVPRRARPWLAGLVLAGFVVLARPEPSVLRAATMGAIGLVGLSSSRRAAGIPVLSASVVVLLVVDPWLSRSYGFALSTLATLGLLLFARPWGGAIGHHLPRRARGLGTALAIPVAAQAMCAPVIVLLQGSVSVVGVATNLLAAPLVSPATVAGVAAALVAPVWARGAALACWLAGLPTEGIARIARVGATVPGGTMPWPDGPAGAVLLAVVTGFLVLTGRWWAHQVARHPVVATALALVVVAGSAPTASATWPPRGWRFIACDVGQGDGLVLATDHGHAVVVDAGPDPALINGCLSRLRVSVLDGVVLTHFHADHVDGLPGVLRGRQVREILTTPVHEPDFQWREVQRWASARGIPVRAVSTGDRLSWPGVSAEVWWPARRIAEGSIPNNASVVLAVHTGGLQLLLLGDVEREAAHAILLELRRDPHLAAEARTLDVVKAPHHGSANLDPDLMAAVRAPVAVISVGKDNDYGHPSPRALQVLRDDGSTTFRTDQRGDIAVVDESGRPGVTWRSH